MATSSTTAARDADTVKKSVQPAVRTPVLACVAFLCGAGWLGTEITAVRAFAPWFGTSSPVWSNVIAVLLATGAVGSLLGGRFARFGVQRERAALLSIGAALGLMLGSLCLPQLAEAIALPLGATPPEARPLLTFGSLALALAVLGIPVLCMGTLTPLLATCGSMPLGGVLAASTCGGLVAVLLIDGACLDALGPRGVLYCAAVAYGLAALMLGLRGARLAGGIATVMALTLVVAAPGPDARPWPSNAGETTEMQRLLVAESDYQHLHVSRVRCVDNRFEVRLALDEGLGEFHSLFVEGHVLTGQYYDTLALAGFAAAEQHADADVLILGGGAGTLPRVLDNTLGSRLGAVISVELDPAVIATSSLLGSTSAQTGKMLAADARRFLESVEHKFSLIVLDAFARQLAIPAHLFTTEFLAAVCVRLKPDGIFAVNVSTQDLESPLMQVLGNTLRLHFGTIEAIGVPNAWSVVLLCAKAPGRDLLPASVPVSLQDVLATARGVRWSLQPPQEGMLILTDDHAPLEKLARIR